MDVDTHIFRSEFGEVRLYRDSDDLRPMVTWETTWPDVNCPPREFTLIEASIVLDGPAIRLLGKMAQGEQFDLMTLHGMPLNGCLGSFSLRASVSMGVRVDASVAIMLPGHVVAQPQIMRASRNEFAAFVSMGTLDDQRFSELTGLAVDAPGRVYLDRRSGKLLLDPQISVDVQLSDCDPQPLVDAWQNRTESPLWVRLHGDRRASLILSAPRSIIGGYQVVQRSGVNKPEALIKIEADECEVAPWSSGGAA